MESNAEAVESGDLKMPGEHISTALPIAPCATNSPDYHLNPSSTLLSVLHIID
jgi:hypothetical protein